MKRCYNCKFFCTEDEGYSNYTVLNTMIHCLKNKFEPTDESYSWTIGNGSPENDHVFFKQAETCEHFIGGADLQLNLDVDGYETVESYSLDNDVREAAVKYFKDIK